MSNSKAVAIIGTGWGARVQVPAFRSAGLEVVALAGHDPAKTRRIAADLGVPRGVDDWHILLERDDVALVSIVTPPDLHAAMCEAALAAGKHVLCEKPTALNAAQAQQILNASRSRPDQLSLIDHELRFLPGLIRARRLITDGEIGQVQFAIGLSIASGRSDPKRAWSWWFDASHGGGLLGAIGSHQIDTLRYLLRSEPTEVAATLSAVIPERPSPEGPKRVTADDTFSLRLRFGNGALVSLDSTAVARLGEPDSLTIYGDEGTLRWIGGQLLLAAAPSPALRDITPPHQHELPTGLSGDYAHGTVYLAHALREFLDGNLDALAPGATFLDGLHIQEALDAARQSNAQDGRYTTVEQV